ncbi:serine/threonine-protein kinase RsbW [Rhodovulum iodosum]|uniref:Serine/threonine-protein kinase RsbW n=1 Tax=Rhodovulum iodosum TaxID=68291 RepID=A0ABV3XTJ9_9RHOB|nr:ATP-binding protein [Rhodovulum robiginosum]RSK30448.1 ATP-binding protein [Rhodovulum robiginosum]
MTARPLCPLAGAGQGGPGAAPALVLDFAARPFEVRRSLATVARHLTEAGLGPETRGRVEIVLAEALNNIVEHAYRGQPAGRVTLALRREGGLARVRLCDHGAPMPDGAPPARAPARGTLPEGGFGWTLIRALSARAAYRRMTGGNCLDLEIALG